MHTATENEEPVGKMTKRFFLDSTLDPISFCVSTERTTSTVNMMRHARNAFDVILSLKNDDSYV